VTIDGPRVLILCRRCGSDKSRTAAGPLLAPLAEQLGVGVYKLLEPAWAWAQWGHRAHPGAAAEPLPGDGAVAGAASGLLSSGGPLAWLTEARGIAETVIRDNRIGWNIDRRALWFPMYDAAGELVAFKWRFPRDGAQMRSWPGGGRRWPLYPPLRPAREVGRGVLVVAGELDALRARSEGLHAVSVTTGAGTWLDRWTVELAGRRVVVCFDNQPEECRAARNIVRRLRAAGVAACRLDLARDVGFGQHKGDLSGYFASGGTADALRRAAARYRGLSR
jgi:hypothetical protein